MKTKSFLLFSSSVFAISVFLIVFHSQPPKSFQSIVTQTHQHIKDFQVNVCRSRGRGRARRRLNVSVMFHSEQASVLPQEKLRDVQESALVQEERYLRLVGLDGRTEPWHNCTLPALVTYARGDDHALAISFVRAAAHLPYTVLLYNLGLKPYSLAVVSLPLHILLRSTIMMIIIY